MVVFPGVLVSSDTQNLVVRFSLNITEKSIGNSILKTVYLQYLYLAKQDPCFFKEIDGAPL